MVAGNLGIFSEYVFRGLTQTGGKPALQGGADYAHSSGFYIGTWLSNVSWLADSGFYSESSLEWDIYGGYKGTFGGDFGYDIGLLQYYYPARRLFGAVNPNTLEAYGALSWKWLSAKYSYSLTDRTFGVQDSFGSWYLDLSINFPVTDKFNILAHYGIQKFTGNGGLTCGNPPTPGDNDTCASYSDYKIGATYALPESWTVGAYYTDTSMDSRVKAFYTSPNSLQLGKGTVTAYIQKTF
jgi:uncharacterized protein (TIGR02001 family)